MVDRSHAYNTVWQLRADAWCRLEEAAERLSWPTASRHAKEQYATVVGDLLAQLTPVEPYWAYPGAPQFARMQRLFAAGHYDKFARTVSRINRALTTDSYRTGEAELAGLDDQDVFPTDPRQLEQQPVTNPEQLYFEVLVVESMTEAQERALRNEVRSWRRPDDEFVYELVVVPSGDEALIAARLNVNLQAVVIRRRFSHRSTRDLSSLAEFVDTHISDELADHQSPDDRAQILAASLAELRPELDLYLMAEIEVEDIAGRMGEHFRRVFHAREGVLELHLSILQGVAARYRTPFFSALKQYSHRPAFRDKSGASEQTPEGDVCSAFYLAYNHTFCEYLTDEQIVEKLDAGTDVVSATFVTPYPPGFPVLVPGQLFSREILSFIRTLDTREIHGYQPEFGYRVYTEKAIEIASQAHPSLCGNGHSQLEFSASDPHPN